MAVLIYCKISSKQFDLDQRFCKYGSYQKVFPSQNDIAALPEVEHHNNQIQAAIDFHCNNRPSFAIIDKGRNNEERSFGSKTDTWDTQIRRSN
jgi:DNA polymerase-3 subunit epsilon